METSKIIILVPEITAHGGAANYYKVLRNSFGNNIEYFTRGSRHWPHRNNFIYELYRGFSDLTRFIFKIKSNSIKLVQIVTSLSSLAVLRDSFFLIVSKLFGKKVIVFFRGWDYNFAQNLSGLKLWFFKSIFFKSDNLIDLALKNKEILKGWGYTKMIYLETTVVEENLISSINENDLNKKLSSDCTSKRILFLARVERNKGVFELIEAYKKLKSKDQQYELIIAGDGLDYNKVSNLIINQQIKDVSLLGYVLGTSKINAYLTADIYVFPTYTEGMPNSLLEAMSFGLPIITRPVGGIPDIFKDGTNGYLLDSKDSEELASLIEFTFSDLDKFREIGLNNYKYARENFTVAKITMRQMDIFNRLLKEST